ncbi:MAG: N(4)-(beta-N-acetylglucosaminyl)-L-asparaginase [Gemmatimonadaceae bacterium]|nr:N(4)-(beta-N-acetylglucosaminyl)-L-asparaginase [Gemmatimonadaceae bacterium]NUR19711.1 N(4)-(beta-N-acetylglucosaminyl)-L-asparaginase [Gemmatimonadaceae bacterium]
MSISRRDFLGAGATVAAGLTLGRPASAQPVITVVERAAPAAAANRPIIVSSANGLRGVARAYEMIAKGADPLDAAIAGVNIQELDPTDQSVGLGGLPNEDGVVQLDASCMHGPSKRAGAVAAIEGIATPSLVAKAVMDYTDHIMLVGEGAKRFALEMGFKEQNLLTEQSRQDWMRWKRKLNPDDNWIEPPAGDSAATRGASAEKLRYDADGVPHTYGTINMCAVDAKGDIGSVTTTSGLSWKIPGRVGDSPIIGAGQYCDNEVGAAGSTGRGEANIKVCGAFLAVEFMRQGMSPADALVKVMQRVIAMTEPRLLDERGRPYFDLNYYAVTKDGRYAGAAAYEGSSFAVADAKGARLEPCVYLYKRSERPTKRPISGTMIKP